MNKIQYSSDIYNLKPLKEQKKIFNLILIFLVIKKKQKKNTHSPLFIFPFPNIHFERKWKINVIMVTVKTVDHCSIFRFSLFPCVLFAKVHLIIPGPSRRIKWQFILFLFFEKYAEKEKHNKNKAFHILFYILKLITKYTHAIYILQKRGNALKN